MITKKMRRDTQKQKVYKWQNNYIDSVDHEALDIVTCQLLANDVLRCYKINREIKVFSSISKKRAGQYRVNFDISLSDYGKIRPIVLHEIAHAITRIYYGYSVPSHGKEFVGFLMILLNKWNRISIKELKRTADLCKVDYVDPKYMIKPKSKIRPKKYLRSKYIFESLPTYIPENERFYLIPGKKGGYDGYYA